MYTVGFGKLEREMLSNDRLPPDLRIAIIHFKNDLRAGVNITPFENRENNLPEAAVGQRYLEYDVGAAHPGDARPRGKRRLVALVDFVGQIQKVFFTDEHYTHGSWRQLQYP